MFTCANRQFASVAIARRVLLDGWDHVPAAAPDADGRLTGGCTWAVERTTWVDDPEFGPEPWTRIEDCGAEVAHTDDRWECAAGHAHVSAEARDREGWDYAEDAYDAAVIASGGRTPVPATPGATWTPTEVAQLAGALR